MLVLAQASQQASDSADPITWQALGTVAGASAAAFTVIAFLRIFRNITPGTARRLAALIAVALVLLAVVVGSEAGWREWILGLLSGFSAGIAAASLLESSGGALNYSPR